MKLSYKVKKILIYIVGNIIISSILIGFSSVAILITFSLYKLIQIL